MPWGADGGDGQFADQLRTIGGLASRRDGAVAAVSLDAMKTRASLRITLAV